MNGAAYHWPDLEAAESDGAYDADNGWLYPLTGVDPHGWLTEPVFGDADPETGEPPMITAGVPPLPVMALSPLPIPALEDRRIFPHGVAGLAGALT